MLSAGPRLNWQLTGLLLALVTEHHRLHLKPRAPLRLQQVTHAIRFITRPRHQPCIPQEQKHCVATALLLLWLHAQGGWITEMQFILSRCKCTSFKETYCYWHIPVSLAASLPVSQVSPNPCNDSSENSTAVYRAVTYMTS